MTSKILNTVFLKVDVEIVISISRNVLLKSCARFVIERSEIRKKQHAFKSVHFKCRMVLFDLANRFARSKQLLSCWGSGSTIEKFA